MRRQPFSEGHHAPARLLAISERPIENRSDEHCVLRLEFEMFIRDDVKTELRSAGTIASRDLVLCPRARVDDVDDGVASFVRAISVKTPANEKDSWICRAEAESPPWVMITFGARHQADERNTFREIHPFNPPSQFQVIECPEDLVARWMTIPEAAKEFEPSESTFRRRLREAVTLHPEWGTDLIRARRGRGEAGQKGQHSEVTLMIARHIIDDSGWMEQLRLTEVSRRRQCEQKIRQLESLLRKRNS